MNKFVYRRWYILCTFLSFLVLTGSFYFQYVKGLQPCPLCIMQRLCVMLLFVICFISIHIKKLKTGTLLACLQFMMAAAGLFFASRQLWLQSLPAGRAPACMPDLDVLMRYFPWKDVLHALLWGSEDCAEINWQWLGLSMPAWTALYFLLMALIAMFVFRSLRRQLV